MLNKTTFLQKCETASDSENEGHGTKGKKNALASNENRFEERIQREIEEERW